MPFLRSKLAATAMSLGELASLVQTLQFFSVKSTYVFSLLCQGRGQSGPEHTGGSLEVRAWPPPPSQGLNKVGDHLSPTFYEMPVNGSAHRRCSVNSGTSSFHCSVFGMQRVFAKVPY